MNRPVLVPILFVVATFGVASADPAPTVVKVSGPPGAAVLAELRPRVVALLGLTDAERWKALGPDALTILRQLASDPAEMPERRSHAVLGMAYVNNPDATDALHSYATDANVLSGVRQAAVQALAAREGTGSVSLLTPLLADGDADLRLSTARALGGVGGVAARAALQSRLGAEGSPAVRDEIQKALSRTAN